MEQAEHAFLRQLGLSVLLPEDNGTLSWPRVRATCDYTGSVRFEELLSIELTVARLGSKSVTYYFRFACENRPVATGEIVAVCCRIRPSQPPASIAIPSWIRDKLLPFVAST